ncbi:hypothetical protein Pyrfu_1036 [Pyrolobus fumarii 1A]|uniref:Membrane-bound metal-dependent hydrolase n=1 Tax=Pyrolobus fumarii (strain DSM 11204 / 1A) TaxID=694429 RepID=G0EF07_PYRF1|nr:metal-dependent hydrolase [Pyrolobus fumarii]AEM38904.1 hypothetical protein Pyrfu_1036 [Pyrolobus fumarii 1A]
MKLATHVAFSSSIAAALALLAGCPASCAWYAAWSSALVNIALDLLGHEVRGGRPRRTAFSHSFVGPLAFSTVFMTSALLAPPPEALAAIIAILVGSYSHLALDAVTEGGVYPYWPLSSKRWRLASLPYNHPTANKLAMLMGALALLTSLLVRGLPSL